MFAATTAPSVSQQALSLSSQAGQTFTEVMYKTTLQSELAMPDQILPLSSLRATEAGFIEVPGRGCLGLTDWSKRQLSSLLGVRWDRWFDNDLISPSERAEEINRRLGRRSGTWKIRTRRWAAKETLAGDGALRAFVSATYAPIDDMQVLETLGNTLGDRLSELRFVRSDLTSESSQYAVVSLEEIDLGIRAPDHHRNGFIVANSEVGSRALSILVWIWRLVCTNGLVAADSEIFRMVHRRQKEESLGERLTKTIRLLPGKWKKTETVLRQARQEPVSDPSTALEVLVEQHPALRPIPQTVFDAYEADPEPTRFGLVQAITRVAQGLTPEQRLSVEEFAGQVIARSSLPEVSL